MQRMIRVFNSNNEVCVPIFTQCVVSVGRSNISRVLQLVVKIALNKDKLYKSVLYSLSAKNILKNSNLSASNMFFRVQLVHHYQPKFELRIKGRQFLSQSDHCVVY